MSHSCEQYYRQVPVRTFDLNQTLYQTIFAQDADNMDVEAVGFGGYRMTFAELKKMWIVWRMHTIRLGSRKEIRWQFAPSVCLLFRKTYWL